LKRALSAALKLKLLRLGEIGEPAPEAVPGELLSPLGDEPPPELLDEEVGSPVGRERFADS
jgi:hypothetical protein